MYENSDYPAGCIFFTGFKLYLNGWNTVLYIYIIINIFSAITKCLLFMNSKYTINNIIVILVLDNFLK